MHACIACGIVTPLAALINGAVGLSYVSTAHFSKPYSRRLSNWERLWWHSQIYGDDGETRSEDLHATGHGGTHGGCPREMAKQSTCSLTDAIAYFESTEALRQYPFHNRCTPLRPHPSRTDSNLPLKQFSGRVVANCKWRYPSMELLWHPFDYPADPTHNDGS